MATLTRRVQILLDDARYAQLERQAERTGQSVAALIRAAVDRMYGTTHEERRDAVQRFLGAEPATVADWPEEKRVIRDRDHG